MSTAYNDLNTFVPSDDDAQYDRDAMNYRRGTVQGGGVDIRNDHIDYHASRNAAPAMKDPIKSRNQIGMKNYNSTSNKDAPSSAKKSTNDSSTKKPVPKIPMSSSNFGKPMPAATKKTTTGLRK